MKEWVAFSRSQQQKRFNFGQEAKLKEAFSDRLNLFVEFHADFKSKFLNTVFILSSFKVVEIIPF